MQRRNRSQKRVKPKNQGRKRVKPISNLILDFSLAKGKLSVEFREGSDHQTDKDHSRGLAGQSTTPHRQKGRASTFNAVCCRPHDVETDADRLCPSFDRRPESRLAARRAYRGRMRKDFHRANVRCGCGSPSPARRPRIRAQRRHADCVEARSASAIDEAVDRNDRKSSGERYRVS
jgi:hypothetical protein